MFAKLKWRVQSTFLTLPVACFWFNNCNRNEDETIKVIGWVSLWSSLINWQLLHVHFGSPTVKKSHAEDRNYLLLSNTDFFMLLQSKQGRFSGADSWWNLWTQRMTMFTLARNWKIECQLKKDLDKMLFISGTLFEKRKSLASSECYLYVHGKSEVIQWLSIYNKYIFWYSFKDVVFATSCQL